MHHNDCAVIAPSLPIATGDFVILYPADRSQQPLCKKVILPPPNNWQRWSGASEAEPIIVVDQLNPHRRYTIRTSKLAAIHRVAFAFAPGTYQRAGCGGAEGLDPFAFGGAQDGDGRLLTLFRRWLDEWKASAAVKDREDAYGAAIDRIISLEHEMADTPAQGAVGMSIKAYLACHYEHDVGMGGNPAGVSCITRDMVFFTDSEEPDGYVDMHCIAAVIRDAARFVPEIAQLAGPITNPSREQIEAETARSFAKVGAWRRPSCIPGGIIEATVEPPDGSRGV